MEYYEITLQGMKHLLERCGETQYAEYVDHCLYVWQNFQNVEIYPIMFSPRGKFGSFRFNEDDFSSEEQSYLVQKTFEALTAMGAQLAIFIIHHHRVSIQFIRDHFGQQTEVMKGALCRTCQAEFTGLSEFYEYISPYAISSAIVDGLETNTLNEKIDAIADQDLYKLKVDKQETLRRMKNSSILLEETMRPLKVCPKCGSSDIEPCRFLKSVKKMGFVTVKH